MSEIIVCLLRPEVVNSAGLALDIGGVILLFFYGLPEEISKTGAGHLTWGEDKEEAKKWKRYKRRSRWGLVLLVWGFFLQLVSNWL